MFTSADNEVQLSFNKQLNLPKENQGIHGRGAGNPKLIPQFKTLNGILVFLSFIKERKDTFTRLKKHIENKNQNDRDFPNRQEIRNLKNHSLKYKLFLDR